ncbi:50S ribosomal protein L6 [Patescibacteria group bacterium]|nr:50S ribosomal protein L6 [Patescibacteria group bacterium]MCL5091684.1 50S ribosomal protein L6 [Patescibacteria group bacterium]
MSKIGETPIGLPAGVTVTVAAGVVTVAGQHGTLTYTLPPALSTEKAGEKLMVKRTGNQKKIKALHGLYRSLIANAVTGVAHPFSKRLEVVGTGFGVKLQGEDLQFKLGFSHPVIFKKVAGIQYQVEGNNKVVVLGVDKQLVGQVAYQIKIIKKPDVYKGKGIRYAGERLRIKPGKKVKAAGPTQ